MRNSIYSISLDEALEAVGGHHTYQLLVMSVGGVLGTAVGGTLKAEEWRRGKNYWEDIGEGNMRDVDSIPVLYLSAVAGILLFGLLVNCLGRKKSLLMGCFALTVSTASISASVTSAFLYFALPICGCALSGVSLTVLLTMVETTNAHYRASSSAVFLSFLLAGYSGMGLVGLCLQQWRLLWMICAVVWICGFAFVGKLLETPCYLACVRGKYGQARSILQEIAEINGKPPFLDMLEGEKVIGYREFSQEIPEAQVSNPDSPKLAFAPITTGITSVSQAETTHQSRYFYWHLVWLRSLRRPFLSCTVIWTCLFFTNCSLVQSNEGMLEYGGALGAIPVLWMLFLLAQRVGRIPTILVAFIMTGLSCLLGSTLIAYPCHSALICRVNRVFSTAALYIGFLGAESAQCILLLYTIELFPSAIRSVSLAGLWACCGVIGSILPLLLVYVQLSPVLSSGLSLLFLSPWLYFMKDTVEEDQSDYIQEEQEEMEKPADLSQIEVRTLPTLGPRPNPFPFQPFKEEE